jgi:hypothetical protein
VIVRAKTIADRNRRIAEREAAGRAAEEREAAEFTARQAAETAARESERQAREEAEATRLAEHTKREAAETAEREAIPRHTLGRPEKEEAPRGVKDRDRRPSFGENSSEPTRGSAHAPDRLRQCIVLVRPILLFTQQGNALLAFLLGSNKTHDAIDSDGVAPLVEAFDYDCSLAVFHGGNMHFLIL